jgi:hypothetical protein
MNEIGMLFIARTLLIGAITARSISITAAAGIEGIGAGAAGGVGAGAFAGAAVPVSASRLM